MSNRLSRFPKVEFSLIVTRMAEVARTLILSVSHLTKLTDIQAPDYGSSPPRQSNNLEGVIMTTNNPLSNQEPLEPFQQDEHHVNLRRADHDRQVQLFSAWLHLDL